MALKIQQLTDLNNSTNCNYDSTIKYKTWYKT